MEVVSSASLSDIRNDFGTLDIRYGNINLRDTQQTLAFVTLRISNDGTAPIKKDCYDDAAPIGVHVIGGHITQVQVYTVNSNNLYIAEHAAPNIVQADPFSPDNCSATIKPVIMEPGDFFWMKLFILYNEKSPFQLKPIGKIAGVKDITFVNLNTKEAPPSFWKQVFAGKFWVQVVRILIFFFGPFFGLGFVTISMAALKTARKRAIAINQKNNRKIQVLKFKTEQLDKGRLSIPDYNWVLNEYIEGGDSVLELLKRLVEAPSLFKLSSIPTRMTSALLDLQAFKLDGESVSVDPLFKAFVLMLYSFTKDNP